LGCGRSALEMKPPKTIKSHGRKPLAIQFLPFPLGQKSLKPKEKYRTHTTILEYRYQKGGRKAISLAFHTAAPTNPEQLPVKRFYLINFLL
jgi:hypothetical protein